MKRNSKYILLFIVLMLPSILLQIALIKLFPYTGLGRIISIPVTIFINTMLIIVCVIFTYKYRKKVLIITTTLFLTLTLTVGLYPQESGPSIINQSMKAVKAIQDFDYITREDLKTSGNSDNPQYIVALYKFKDELLSEGVYQLYQKENVYFYNYSVNELNEIPSKLIGYHKVMWWYLNRIKLS